MNHKTLLLSLGVGASIALYILIDKIAPEYIDPVSVLAPLREIGTVFGAMIGATFFFDFFATNAQFNLINR